MSGRNTIKTNTNTQIINKSKCISITSTPPNTPVSSHPMQDCKRVLSNETTYSVEHSIKCQKYKPIEQIAQTLQGCIWRVSQNENTYIVKVTNKLLHSKHITNFNGQQIHISENIIQETAILKYLSSNNPPKSLVKYIDFFCDDFNYFFVMEYGGEMSLFDFVKRCHQYIDQGVLAIEEWHTFCKMAMRQMCDLVDWLHNTMNCTHLDISLENFCIDDVMITQNTETKAIAFLPGFQIRIIDFGVAEVFYSQNKHNQIDFRCSKYVGKTLYKAPEVYKKTEVFDARNADCWSLSVVFFMMLIGCPPWRKPSNDDITFNLIMNGHLDEILFQWSKMNHITVNILNLLSLLFQPEKYRLTIREIKRHPFLL